MQLPDNVFYSRFVFFQVRNARKKQKTAFGTASTPDSGSFFSEMKLKKKTDGLYYMVSKDESEGPK